MVTALSESVPRPISSVRTGGKIQESARRDVEVGSLVVGKAGG